jgi:uncharacterized protein (DUF1778 family)
MKNMRSERAYLIRFDSELYELLKKVADARGESVSTFVRRAVLRELARLSYLDEERKKALEL